MDELVGVPVWADDSSSDRCNNCKAKFSLFLRRHHCRTCGQLVCDRCSQGRAKAAVIPSKPAKLQEQEKEGKYRTCDSCMMALPGDDDNVYVDSQAAGGRGFMRNVDSILAQMERAAPVNIPLPRNQPQRVPVSEARARASFGSPRSLGTPRASSVPSPLHHFLFEERFSSPPPKRVPPRFDFSNFRRVAEFSRDEPTPVLLRWVGDEDDAALRGTVVHTELESEESSEYVLRNSAILSAVRAALDLPEHEPLKVLAKVGPPRHIPEWAEQDMRPAFWNSSKGVVQASWTFNIRSERTLALDLCVGAVTSVRMETWFQLVRIG